MGCAWGMRRRNGKASAATRQQIGASGPRGRRGGAVPDPEVLAKPTRRQFAAEYRLRILEEADRCTDRGEIGRLLRREGLYSSHLANWRKAGGQGAPAGLKPKKTGRKPAGTNRGDLPQARRGTRNAHPALRPRLADDQPGHRATARPARRDPIPGPAAGQRRQSLLRSPVQDPEVPPRLPRTLPGSGCGNGLLQILLPLVQHAAPTCRHRHAHPRDRLPRQSTDRAPVAPGSPSTKPGSATPNDSSADRRRQGPLPAAVWINPPDGQTSDMAH